MYWFILRCVTSCVLVWLPSSKIKLILIIILFFVSLFDFAYHPGITNSSLPLLPNREKEKKSYIKLQLQAINVTNTYEKQFVASLTRRFVSANKLFRDLSEFKSKLVNHSNSLSQIQGVSSLALFRRRIPNQKIKMLYSPRKRLFYTTATFLCPQANRCREAPLY